MQNAEPAGLPDEEAARQSSTELFVMELGGELFAIEAASVEEIAFLPRITPLPHPSPVLQGLFNNRGELIIAVDVARLLGKRGWVPRSYARIVIVSRDGPKTGLLVDGTVGVMPLEDTVFEALSEAEQGRLRLGVARRPEGEIYRLDLARLMEEIAKELSGAR